MGYLGSKAASGAYQAIISLMPPHDTYVELFAGSGAVLLRKPPATWTYAIDKDGEVAAALQTKCKAAGLGPVVYRRDAFDFLCSFIRDPEQEGGQGMGRVLIYADPPYLHSVRTSRQRYRHELDDDDHRRLLRMLRRVPASVILSGYPSPLYDRLLPGWHTLEFQAMTRGGPRTEKLWYNFEPSAVHWASWAGRNFTERQRIKRKAARWAAHYKRLPAGERLAVLAGLLAIGSIDAPVSTRGPLSGNPSQPRVAMPDRP